MQESETAMMNKIESLDKQRLEQLEIPKKRKVFIIDTGSNNMNKTQTTVKKSKDKVK